MLSFKSFCYGKILCKKWDNLCKPLLVKRYTKFVRMYTILWGTWYRSTFYHTDRLKITIEAYLSVSPSCFLMISVEIFWRYFYEIGYSSEWTIFSTTSHIEWYAVFIMAVAYFSLFTSFKLWNFCKFAHTTRKLEAISNDGPTITLHWRK